MPNAVTTLAMNAKIDGTCTLQLWEAIERLICKWAFRFIHKNGKIGFELDDLMQAGYLAMHDAVLGYDPSVGTEFTTYLYFHVYPHFLKVAGWSNSKFRPKSYNASYDDEIQNDPTAEESFCSIIEQIHNGQLHDALEACMSTLTTIEADILRSRFYRGKTLCVIAKEYGKCGEAIRQTEKKALRNMRRGKNLALLSEYRDYIISH